MKCLKGGPPLQWRGTRISAVEKCSTLAHLPMRYALLVLFLCALPSACNQAPPDRLGYHLDVPSDWRSIPPQDLLVPGRPVEAWRIPGGGSAVIFTQIPQKITVAQYMTLTLNQIAAQPAWTLEQHETRRIGDLDAMVVTLSGPGTGEAMAPTPTGEPLNLYKGRPLLATRRVWVVFVRETDALCLFFHYPVGREGEVRPTIDAVLKTLRVERVARSAY